MVKGAMVKRGCGDGGPMDPEADTTLDPKANTPPLRSERQTPTLEMATEVGGVHPTGMHSCFLNVFDIFLAHA